MLEERGYEAPTREQDGTSKDVCNAELMEAVLRRPVAGQACLWRRPDRPDA